MLPQPKTRTLTRLSIREKTKLEGGFPCSLTTVAVRRNVCSIRMDEGGGMGETFDDWMAARDGWLQTAAANLLEKGKPDAADVTALADMCIAEELKQPFFQKKLPKGTFSEAQIGKVLRLRNVNGLQGINALDPAAKLDFNDADLTIVYGTNGCGKSGFARLFRLAVGSRKSGALLSNIYSNAPVAQTALFEISENGKQSSLTWTATGGPLTKLKQIHVFDNLAAKGYLVDKEEVSYEPRRLRFLGALSDVCDLVRDELASRETLLSSKLPAVPTPLLQTELASLLTSLKASDTEDGIGKKLIRKANHDQRRNALTETVKNTDPATRLSTLAASIKHVDALNEKLKIFKDVLSVDAIKKIVEHREKARTARSAANELAKSTLTGSALDGIGGHTWKVMWEAARKFSASITSITLPFPPTEGNLCPLCQTDLDSVAVARMNAFEDFIKGQAETDAKTAETDYTALIDTLPKLPTIEDWQALFPVAQEDSAQLYTDLEKALEDISNGKIELISIAVGHTHIVSIHEAITPYRVKLVEEQDLLTASLDAAQLTLLQVELADLTMLDWCHDNLPAIFEELARIKKLDTLKKAGRRANTAEITKKKNALAKDELVGGYQTRFLDELKFFGADRISVKPTEASGAKGKVKFALSLSGAANKTGLEDVLSEGEARVVALANFLADTSISPVTSPFIFDDPISSLDIEFEERVAQRLVELAKQRQVIVFTHRLSLACLLRDAYKRHKDSQSQAGSGTAISLHEISLCRVGNRIGVTGGLNTLSGSIPQGLENLLVRIKLAKTKEDVLDIVGYESDVKSICSDLRMLVERVVEEVLLSSIVLRFRRGIATKDKLASLVKINPQDCAFIEDLMTQYSVYEHSQSVELPSTPPALSKLKGDVEGVQKWIKEFKDRKAAA